MEKQKIIPFVTICLTAFSIGSVADTTQPPNGYYDPLWSPYGAVSQAAPDPIPPTTPCDPLVSTCTTPKPSMHIAQETEFTTLDLFPPNISLTDDSCLGYCFVGTCFWVKCIFPGVCTVETSVRFKHRNPDFVVSVYREPGLNPWQEIRLLYGWAQREVVDQSVQLWGLNGINRAGQGDTVNTSQLTRPLTYREVDVIGYPFKFASVAPNMFCETGQQPGVPAFMSAFDAFNWRVGLLEYLNPDLYTKMPSSYIGGFMQNNWGNIYRRTGFVNAYDDAEANAVIAHRAGNIISQSGQAYLYVPQNGKPASTKKFFTTPPELIANSDAGGVFQMVAPKSENSCHVFGADSDWSDGRQSEDKASAFILWRPYDCCETKGQYYLGTIEAELCI